MALPDVIEVVPLSAPVRAAVVIPGSKSITNRALILAALGRGQVDLQGALWSDDTQVMVDGLRRLGIAIEIETDLAEPGNRRLRVTGTGGGLCPGGSAEAPLDLFVGNAGTAARFLAALVCLGQGAYRLDGVPRMRERPQSALFSALRQLGYRVDSPNDRLPAVIHGTGPKPGTCTVSIEESSQFASALLLSGATGGWNIRITGENADESPYVTMTSDLMRAFPRGGGQFTIEPDASSASYFWGAGWLLGPGGSVNVAHWPDPSLQIDARFPELLGRFPDSISRQHDLGDSIMTAIVLAPFAGRPKRFTELGRLRVQECERVHALRDELRKCGAIVREEGDTLEITPSLLHGAEIETYDDHRVAMCFATLGLKVPGIRLKNPACVRKTFPNFFQKLAASPPGGLGATILDGHTGRPLALDDLHV